MRVFSWIASVGLVFVLGTVTAATLRAQNTGAHAFVAAKPAVTVPRTKTRLTLAIHEKTRMASRRVWAPPCRGAASIG